MESHFHLNEDVDIQIINNNKRRIDVNIQITR